VNPITSCQFGSIHGLISSLEHGSLGITRPGEHGDPEACSDANLDIAAVERRIPKLVRKAPGELRCPFEICLGRDDVELFATDPAEQIDLTQDSACHLGEADQYGITYVVPVLIVNSFEMVEIDGNKRKRLMIADRPRNLPIELRTKGSAVGETG